MYEYTQAEPGGIDLCMEEGEYCEEDGENEARILPKEGPPTSSRTARLDSLIHGCLPRNLRRMRQLRSLTSAQNFPRSFSRARKSARE